MVIVGFKCFSLLSKAKDRLRSLSIAELKLVPRGGNPSEHIEILAQLENLRHLDISDKIDNQNDLFETTIPNAKLNLSDFLEHCNCTRALPQLVSFDISGKIFLPLHLCFQILLIFTTAFDCNLISH